MNSYVPQSLSHNYKLKTFFYRNQRRFGVAKYSKYMAITQKWQVLSSGYYIVQGSVI